MYVNPFWFGFGVGFLAGVAILVLFAFIRGSEVEDDDESDRQ